MTPTEDQLASIRDSFPSGKISFVFASQSIEEASEFKNIQDHSSKIVLFGKSFDSICSERSMTKSDLLNLDFIKFETRCNKACQIPSVLAHRFSVMIMTALMKYSEATVVQKLNEIFKPSIAIQ